MDILIIILIFYAAFLFIDLIPSFKKEKKALIVSIPVYILTFTINVLIVSGVKLPYINEMLMQAIKSMFGMQ